MPTYSNDVFWGLLFHEYSNTFYPYSNIFLSSSNICNRYSNALLLVDGVLLWVEGGVVGVDVAIDSHSQCSLDIGITCCGQMSSGMWRAEARERFSQNAGPLKSLSPQYFSEHFGCGRGVMVVARCFDPSCKVEDPARGMPNYCNHTPTYSIDIPTCSMHFPACSISIPTYSIHIPTCSIGIPTYSIHIPTCSIHIPTCSMHILSPWARKPGHIRLFCERLAHLAQWGARYQCKWYPQMAP